MIRSIHIENFALIKDQTVELEPGLNIVTGETGSGKSIFAMAAAGIFGDDISNDQISYGETNLKIQCELEFDAEKCDRIKSMTDIEADNNIYILSRMVLDKGKNSIRLNGSIISLSTLKQIGAMIFDFHTQNETRELLKKENQVRLLDQFCGGDLVAQLDEYNMILSQMNNKKRKLKELLRDKNDLETKKDILSYQVAEIEKAKLRKNEYEELNNRKRIQENSGKILRSLSDINEVLSGTEGSDINVSDNIKKASKEFDRLSIYFNAYSGIAEELSGIYWRIREIAEEVVGRISDMEYDPAELDDIISRIDLIDKLKKKYGAGIDEILETLEKKKAELIEAENTDIVISNLENDISRDENTLMQLNEVILNKRKGASGELCEKIVGELLDLDMKDVMFDVFFIDRNSNNNVFYQNGNQEVRFAISTNKGQPLKYLDEISSGGEMSRVMLVFKKLISSFDDTDILVFDEIESGVSGAAAFKVGKKIYDISTYRQVICITHIPQVAVFSGNHYKVYKTEKNGVTFSMIEKLSQGDKILEIGKLLGGNRITENALKNAEELIKASMEYIKNTTERNL
jgi:DNA repair protein RecN (Recombination protein N)